MPLSPKELFDQLPAGTWYMRGPQSGTFRCKHPDAGVECVGGCPEPGTEVYIVAWKGAHEGGHYEVRDKRIFEGIDWSSSPAKIKWSLARSANR